MATWECRSLYQCPEQPGYCQTPALSCPVHVLLLVGRRSFSHHRSAFWSAISPPGYCTHCPDSDELLEAVGQLQLHAESSPMTLCDSPTWIQSGNIQDTKLIDKEKFLKNHHNAGILCEYTPQIDPSMWIMTAYNNAMSRLYESQITQNTLLLNNFLCLSFPQILIKEQ